jgi:hypothetical protein
VIGPSRTCSAVGDPHFTNFNGDYFHIQEPVIFILARSDDGEFEVQVRQDGSYRPGTPSYVREVYIRYKGRVYHNSFSQDGFSVYGNGYVVVTVPGRYQDRMEGICGQNGWHRSSANFKLPDGSLADVNYGKHMWEVGGYGGPHSKLSKWQLAWRPTLEDCMFPRADCERNLRHGGGRKQRFVHTPWGRIDTNNF